MFKSKSSASKSSITDIGLVVGFTNDVIILGGRVLEKMAQDKGGRGVGLNITSLFHMISGEKFKQFCLKQLVLL